MIAWFGMIASSGFNPHSGHVVASLDTTLYDDYLCLVVSNKQQISAWWFRTSSKFIGQEFKEFTGTLDHWNLLCRCGFL